MRMVRQLIGAAVPKQRTPAKKTTANPRTKTKKATAKKATAKSGRIAPRADRSEVLDSLSIRAEHRRALVARPTERRHAGDTPACAAHSSRDVALCPTMTLARDLPHART